MHILYLDIYSLYLRLIGCKWHWIGRLSAVLPTIGIGRLASDNNRYRPIIGAGRFLLLFIYFPSWLLSHQVYRSNSITRFNKILLLCNSLQDYSLHGNKFRLCLHFPVSKVYHRFLPVNCWCYRSTNWQKTINQYQTIIGRLFLFGTDNRPKRCRVISTFLCYYDFSALHQLTQTC